MSKEREIPTLAAVIDIGSTAIRMVLIEIQSDGSMKRLDRANKPVPLGIDVFSTYRISNETLHSCVKVLIGYSELLRGWGVEKEHVFVIATSALREARNRETFIDRVQIKTGFKVKVIDGVEENYLAFLAVQHALSDLPKDLSKSSSMIMEVGGGSIELMIQKRGKMVSAHSFKVGTLRLEYQSNLPSYKSMGLESFIHDQFRVTFENLSTETALGAIRFLILMGGDARLVAYHAGAKAGERHWLIKKDAFMDFVQGLQNATTEELIKKFAITYNEAEGLIAALLVYKVFLLQTSAQTIIVPDVSIREGVLINYTMEKENSGLSQAYEEQILASSMSLGQKYHYDEVHAKQIEALSVQFYDQFAHEHGLGSRERLLLRVAALLHDIGYFINASGHHKHGQYIINNSEIFGLSRSDVRIISSVVRHHRNTRPLEYKTELDTHLGNERLIILKLTAMLRVCDALDRGHSQRIKDITLRIEDDILYIDANFTGSVAIESNGLVQKGQLFEDLFGYTLRLQ